MLERAGTLNHLFSDVLKDLATHAAALYLTPNGRLTLCSIWVDCAQPES